MKNSKVISILKQGNIVIPLYLLKNYSKFKISLEEFIFLMYLYNIGEEFLFDPKKLSTDLGIDLGNVMTYISKLTDTGYIKVDVVKNESKIMEERVSLSGFYQKMSLLLSEDINDKTDIDNSNIFEIIEKEFGRTLSPIEYEIIKAWLENNTDEEVIKEALKEATYNGVSNLRYIDKIIYEWGKKGIKTKEDVEKNRLKHKAKDVENQEPIDVFDYDWFDDDE